MCITQSNKNQAEAIKITQNLGNQGIYGEFLQKQIISCAENNIHLPSNPQKATTYCIKNLVTKVGETRGEEGLKKMYSVFKKSNMNPIYYK